MLNLDVLKHSWQAALFLIVFIFKLERCHKKIAPIIITV